MTIPFVKKGPGGLWGGRCHCCPHFPLEAGEALEASEGQWGQGWIQPRPRVPPRPGAPTHPLRHRANGAEGGVTSRPSLRFWGITS